MTLQNHIQTLRKLGWKIKITHYRYVGSNRLMSRREIDSVNESKALSQWAPLLVIQPNGGKVEAEVKHPRGIIAVGVSECSRLDNFTRKIGTAMALGRALKEINLQL